MAGRFKYYEFFAGIGMVRAGLGGGWECLFANDSDKLKQASYGENWPGEKFDGRDVALVTAHDLEGSADLAWASFPCQDLSQAGSKAGIGGADSATVTRSGAVWPFLEIMRDLRAEGRQPTMLALENVVGLLTSNGGANFRTLCSALSELGYRYGAIVADAAHFVPQSRPRVFIVAVRREYPIPPELCGELPRSPWHSQSLLRARAELPSSEVGDWVWWTVGDPPARREFELADVIDLGDGAQWNSEEANTRLLGMMSKQHLERLNEAKSSGRLMIGSLYLRMRPHGGTGNVQRAEITFGTTIGCLRTPKGGASRPRIIVVDGERVRTRLVSVREAALLMGLGEDFNLPPTYNECFRVIGDGVVPTVVRFLGERLLEPLAASALLHAASAKRLKASA